MTGVWIDTVRTCPRHTKLSGDELLQRLLDECILYQSVLDGELTKVLPQHTTPTFDDNDNPVGIMFKRDVVDVTFDDDCNIEVTPKVSLTATERDSINDALQTKFGTRATIK